MVWFLLLFSGEVFLVDKEIVKEHAVGTLGLSEEQVCVYKSAVGLLFCVHLPDPYIFAPRRKRYGLKSCLASGCLT